MIMKIVPEKIRFLAQITNKKVTWLEHWKKRWKLHKQPCNFSFFLAV